MKLLRRGQPPGAVVPPDLLVGDEGEVDGAVGGKGGGTESTEGLEVLEADALHVLGAAGVEVAGGGVEGSGEGGMGPLEGLGRNDIGVGVEEDGGEGGDAAGPLEEEEWLAGGELEDVGLEAEVVGLGAEEADGGGVVGVRLGGVDPEVLPESGNRRLRLGGGKGGAFIGVFRCRHRREEEEQEEGEAEETRKGESVASLH